MDRRGFIGAAGLAAAGIMATASSTSAQGVPTPIEAKITRVRSLGHKENGEIDIETDKGNGWLQLGDDPQSQRIWACLAGLWAAQRTGKSPEARIFYEKLEQVPAGNGEQVTFFRGVKRVYLK